VGERRAEDRGRFKWSRKTYSGKHSWRGTVRAKAKRVKKEGEHGEKTCGPSFLYIEFCGKTFYQKRGPPQRRIYYGKKDSVRRESLRGEGRSRGGRGSRKTLVRGKKTLEFTLKESGARTSLPCFDIQGCSSRGNRSTVNKTNLNRNSAAEISGGGFTNRESILRRINNHDPNHLASIKSLKKKGKGGPLANVPQ